MVTQNVSATSAARISGETDERDLGHRQKFDHNLKKERFNPIAPNEVQERGLRFLADNWLLYEINRRILLRK